MVFLIHLLDPELIVLGGGLAADAGKLLLPVIRQEVSERVLATTGQPLRIELSQLREVDWAIGASLLVGEKALEKLFLSSIEPSKSAASRKAEPSRIAANRDAVPAP